MSVEVIFLVILSGHVKSCICCLAIFNIMQVNLVICFVLYILIRLFINVAADAASGLWVSLVVVNKRTLIVRCCFQCSILTSTINNKHQQDGQDICHYYDSKKVIFTKAIFRGFFFFHFFIIEFYFSFFLFLSFFSFSFPFFIFSFFFFFFFVFFLCFLEFRNNLKVSINYYLNGFSVKNNYIITKKSRIQLKNWSVEVKYWRQLTLHINGQTNPMYAYNFTVNIFAD